MRKTLILAVVLLFVLAACGGDDSSDSASNSTSADGGSTSLPEGEGSSNAGNGGKVVDAPSPGQATASVDTKDFSFELPGGVACNIANDEFSFSFRIGDNEVTLGGGGFFQGNSGWGGFITIAVGEPEGEQGPIQYFANLADHGASALAFDGNSMSYAGPMQKQPPNDGTNPPPIDVGDGTISVTCP